VRAAAEAAARPPRSARRVMREGPSRMTWPEGLRARLVRVLLQTGEDARPHPDRQLGPSTWKVARRPE